MADKVLIVDDDTRLSAMIADYLSGNGYVAHCAGNGLDGIAELSRRSPDAVILDVMLPDIDGLETCRRMRAVSDVPILMLTAKGEETDRIVGLELGADDVDNDPESHEFEVRCEPEVFEDVKKGLEEKDVKISTAEVAMVPQTTVHLQGKPAETMLKMMNALEESDDVQNVWANFDISDEDVEAFG